MKLLNLKLVIPLILFILIVSAPSVYASNESSYIMGFSKGKFTLGFWLPLQEPFKSREIKTYRFC